ncbi:MAG: glycosyltransferase [Amphiplicatus sp.]
MSGSMGFVAIGRNEGARLVACLASLAREGGPIVYVDSGSTDQSLQEAARIGAEIVSLDMARPFTAARARNAGFRRLMEIEPGTDYVQFIDGDCELAPGWTGAARAFLEAHEDVAVVCGRRRERRPEASVYNRLCDAEWDTPAGEALACGGDAMMRAPILSEVNGYRDGLVAGEEPELCLRLREKGWRIWRLDAEMTLHDAAIERFSQWWRRSVRAGHAYAEVSSLHRGSPKRIWARETVRALVWSSIAPLALVAGALVHPVGFGLLLAYPAQIARLAYRERRRGADAPAFAIFSVLSKFAEAEGALRYGLSRLRRRAPQLIEYKA